MKEKKKCNMEGFRRGEREKEGVETKQNNREGTGEKQIEWRQLENGEGRRERIMLIVEFGEETDARGIMESKGNI